MLSGGDGVLSINNIPKSITENSSKMTASLSPNLLTHPKIMDSSKITDYSIENSVQESSKLLEGRISQQSKEVLLG